MIVLVVMEISCMKVEQFLRDRALNGYSNFKEADQFIDVILLIFYLLFIVLVMVVHGLV